MTLRWTHGDSSKHNSAVQTSVQVESRGSEYLTSSNPEKTSEWYIEIRLLGVPIEKPSKQNRSYLNWKSYLFRKCNAECRKIFTFITSNLVLFWPWLTGLTTHHTPSSGATPCDTSRRHLTQGSPTAKGNFPTRISKRNTCSDSAGTRKCVIRNKKTAYLILARLQITSPNHTTSQARMDHMLWSPVSSRYVYIPWQTENDFICPCRGGIVLDCKADSHYIHAYHVCVESM